MKPIRPQQGHAGFTLIEVVVVVVLMGILAAVIAPRLLDTEARRSAATAEGIRALLSVAAHREALGGRRLAIDYVQERGTLQLLTVRTIDGRAVEWTRDPLSPEATIRPLALRSATIDGSVLDAREWRIELPRHEPRGLIELTFESAEPSGIDRRWTVVLLPEADAAVMREGSSGSGAAVQAIDLDARGRGQQPW